MIFCVLCCIGMFAAMITSNLLSHVDLTAISGGLFILFFLLIAVCFILLCVSKHLDRTVLAWAQVIRQKLEAKICRHWKILLAMALLRQSGAFDCCAVLDEVIWMCYAAFFDD